MASHSTGSSAQQSIAAASSDFSDMSQTTLSHSNAHTTASSAVTTLPSPDPTQATQETSTASSHSLPPPESEQNDMRLPGMKRGIAVGVGVSVATLIILFVAYIAIKRRRKLYKKKKDSSDQTQRDVEKANPAQAFHIKVESDATPIHEMDGSEGPRGELPVLSVDTKEKEDRHHSVIHELPSPLPPDYQESERRNSHIAQELPSPLPSPNPATGEIEESRGTTRLTPPNPQNTGDNEERGEERQQTSSVWASRARSNRDTIGLEEAREFDSAWVRRVMSDAGID